jgi:hypothetical protein
MLIWIPWACQQVRVIVAGILAAAWTTVAGPLQRDVLDGVAQIHVRVWSRLGIVVEAVEAGPAHPAQLHHPLNAQSPAYGPLLRRPCGRPRGFPLDTCSIRCCSMRCKHPFKKSISTAC